MSLRTKSACPICRAPVKAVGVVGLSLRLDERTIGGGEEDSACRQLQGALSESERAKARLEKHHSDLTAQLATSLDQLHHSQLAHTDLQSQCQILTALLEKAHAEVRSLETQLHCEQIKRKQWEDQARELQVCAQAVKEARLFPNVQRAFDLRAQGTSVRDQNDCLLAEVIALTQALDTDRKEAVQRKAQLEAAEAELSSLRYKVKRLKAAGTHTCSSLLLLAPEDVEAEKLRKVQKLATPIRSRPTLLPPTLLPNS